MSTAPFDLGLLPDRFWAKVNRVPSNCWIWTGATTDGYGKVFWEGQVRTAYRVAYEVLVGHVDDGMHLDHLCRNRACVNPEHLEPVTPRENILRGIGPSAQHAMKTHCPSGHEYTELNTYLYRGMRMCRTCRASQGAKASESRAARLMKADPNDPRHGSLTAYSTYRCRCDKCRAGWRDYHRRRKAELARTG